MSTPVDIAVLGAGMSGLCQTYYLRKRFPKAKIAVLEASDRVGGWVDTAHRGDYTFEQGPRGIRPKGKGQIVLALVKELGLWDELAFANDAAKIRYIYLGGKMEKFPSGPLSALTSPLTKGLFVALIKDLTQKAVDRPDETFEAFTRRHFGQTFADRLFDPMVSGIWGAQISKLSIDAAMPILKDFERKKGSIIKSFIGYKAPDYGVQFDEAYTSKALFSFRNGMEVFTKALQAHIAQDLHLNAQVEEITHENDFYKIVLKNGNTMFAKKVISTIPSYALSTSLKNSYTGLSNLLSEIPYAPMAVVSLAYDRDVQFDGFGFLIPSKEQRPILGATANHRVFPSFAPEGKSCFTVMIGGAGFKNFEEKTEGHFISLAKQELGDYLKIDAEPIYSFAKLIPKAIPQYNVGHLSLIEEIKEKQPKGFYVSGNFNGGVSLIDIVMNAKAIAASISI